MFGYSDYSNVVTILCAQAPSKPAAPITHLSGTKVIVTWQQPLDQGSPLTKYSVYLKQNDGVMTLALGDCDPLSSLLLTSLTCSVTSAFLVASPYLLPWGSSVYAQV